MSYKVVDFSAPLLGLYGEKQQIKGTDNVANYRFYAVQALASAYENESVPYEAKLFRTALAQKIGSVNEPVAVSFVEAMLITELVGRMAPLPIVVTRFTELFAYTEPVPAGKAPKATAPEAAQSPAPSTEVTQKDIPTPEEEPAQPEMPIQEAGVGNDNSGGDSPA
jgi:hypothetical protein